MIEIGSFIDEFRVSKKNKKQHQKDIKDIKHKSIKTKKQPSKTKKSLIKTKSTTKEPTTNFVEAFTKVGKELGVI